MTIDISLLQTTLRVNGITEATPDDTVRDLLRKMNHTEEEIAEFLAWRHGETGAVPATPVVPQQPQVAAVSSPQPLGATNPASGWFRGRVNRKNFLFGNVVFFVVYAFLALAQHFLGSSTAFLVIAVIVIGLMIIPSLSLQVRRLHDIGHSWLLVLLNLIPYVNFGFYLYLLIRKGDPAANAYGSPPAPQPFWRVFFAKV